jgi:Cys-tRNA(Pro)/Cys-tRNA(Cys) deacylase
MAGKGHAGDAAAGAGGRAARRARYEPDPRAASYGEGAAARSGIEPERMLKTLLAEVATAGWSAASCPVSGSLDLKALAIAVGGKRGVMAEPRGASGRPATSSAGSARSGSARARDGRRRDRRAVRHRLRQRRAGAGCRWSWRRRPGAADRRGGRGRRAMTRPVEAVLFDWGGTLSQHVPVDLLDMWRAAARVLAPETPEPVAQALLEARTTGGAPRWRPATAAGRQSSWCGRSPARRTSTLPGRAAGPTTTRGT